MEIIVSVRGWKTVMVSSVIASVAACAGHLTADPVPIARCESGDTALVRDVLYFGRNRPDGGSVSDVEWQAFLDEVVTPRFPAGLTVVEAVGQWRGQSGQVERERAEVLTLLHAGDEPTRRAVADVAEEYKRRFHQEAVLRERTSACTHF
jgi:Protein of unknown function (DUF3574)